MSGMLLSLCIALTSGFLAEFFGNDIMVMMVGQVFYIEETIYSGSINIHQVDNFMFSVGIALVTLKFLKKGFDIYVGWYDGDKDANPSGLLINLFKALGAMIGFKALYEILYKVTVEITDGVLSAFAGLNVDVNNFAEHVQQAVGQSLGLGILALVWIIMMVILYVQFIARGAEMFITRLFFPIACVGLIDSNQGVFAPYVKNFFLCASTCVVQMVCFKFTLFFIQNADFIYAVAFGIMALSTPKLLDKFMLRTGSGGAGVMQTIRTVQSISTMIAKR